MIVCQVLGPGVPFRLRAASSPSRRFSRRSRQAVRITHRVLSSPGLRLPLGRFGSPVCWSALQLLPVAAVRVLGVLARHPLGKFGDAVVADRGRDEPAGEREQDELLRQDQPPRRRCSRSAIEWATASSGSVPAATAAAPRLGGHVSPTAASAHRQARGESSHRHSGAAVRQNPELQAENGRQRRHVSSAGVIGLKITRISCMGIVTMGHNARCSRRSLSVSDRLGA